MAERVESHKEEDDKRKKKVTSLNDNQVFFFLSLVSRVVLQPLCPPSQFPYRYRVH